MLREAVSRLTALMITTAGLLSAGQITIDFTGTITAGTSDLSKFELLYYATDGVDEIRQFQPIYNAGTSNRFCAATQTCDLSGTIMATVASPLTFTPTTSAYTVMGYYDGGPTVPDDISGFNVIANPRVFVLSTENLTGADFLTTFGFDELAISTHIRNGWSESFAAYQHGTTFVSSNVSMMPSITLQGSGSSATIYDFSTGVANGSATISAAVEGAGATPEPGTWLLLAGGMALIAAFRRNRVA